MTAAEARRLTDEVLTIDEEVVKSLVDYALVNIASAVKSGISYVKNPFGGFETTKTEPQFKAHLHFVRNKLKIMGYRVEFQGDDFKVFW